MVLMVFIFPSSHVFEGLVADIHGRAAGWQPPAPVPDRRVSQGGIFARLLLTKHLPSFLTVDLSSRLLPDSPFIFHRDATVVMPKLTEQIPLA
jgi:hypothetical protein